MQVNQNKANKIVRFIFLNCVFAFFTASSWSQSPTTENQEHQDQPRHAQIYITGANEHGGPLTDPQTIFNCTEKIISVVNLENYPLGEHHLSVKWIDPYSEVKELTEYYFTIRNSQTRVWAWLSFDRGTGAGVFQWINPSAGLEDFIGPWKIEVKIDNKKIGEDNFEVSC